MTIRSVAGLPSPARTAESEAPSAPGNKQPLAIPGSDDGFAAGPARRGEVRAGTPALPAGSGFNYDELSAGEKKDFALRQAAAQNGVELPATRDSLAAVFNDDDGAAARLVGRSVMTQGDVTDALKDLGLDAGDTLSDPKSQASIKAVQEAFGLPVTGQLDAETLMAILQAKAADDRRSQSARQQNPRGGLDAAGAASRGSSGAGAGAASGNGAAGSSDGAGSDPMATRPALTPEQLSNYQYQAGDVTPEKLAQMSPGLSLDKAREVAPHLNEAMKEAGITTPARQAAFIAQVAHESGNFKYSEEIASGRQYEGRRDLGNTQPGDGERFKGRGYIQLTGRANYAAAGKALGLDLVNHPELASRPENAARIAAWYWNSRGLNGKADRGDFDGITRAINGGYNGKADRDRRYAAALRAVGDGTALA